MKHAVQIQGRFASAATRNTERGNGLALLTGKAIWQQEDSIGTDPDGTPTWALTARFDGKADLDTVYAAILGRITSSADWLASSRLARHVCSHDAATPTPCALDAELVK